METIPVYWIHREKPWTRSSESHDGQRRSSFVDCSEHNRGTTASQFSRYLYAATGTRVSRGACPPEFLLTDDNARPHRALLVYEFLESEDICRRMDCTARSPDLNLIEHVWDALRRAIATRNPPPRNIQEMKTALLNEWDQLPQKLINYLISSTTTRCEFCIAVRGDPFLLFILHPLFHTFQLQRVLRTIMRVYCNC
ncbi:DDE_3 domain-containing protein [Trichonephila clavipes]|nr:DDE_3 domain-containing protein [Trichonephila clavipes]